MRRGPALITLLTAAAACACLFAGAGCSSRSRRVPGWMDNPPVDDNYLYAVGSYVGAFYPEDNRKHAVKAAIANLGAQMRTRVKDRMVMTSSGGSASVARRAEAIADNAVQNAQPTAYWVDWEGDVDCNAPGTVYVLVRAPMPTPE